MRLYPMLMLNTRMARATGDDRGGDDFLTDASFLLLLLLLTAGIVRVAYGKEASYYIAARCPLEIILLGIEISKLAVLSNKERKTQLGKQSPFSLLSLEREYCRRWRRRTQTQGK